MNLVDACLTEGRIAARWQRLRHRCKQPHELIRSLENMPSAQRAAEHHTFPWIA
jgi:hypothetical protein